MPGSEEEVAARRAEIDLCDDVEQLEVIAGRLFKSARSSYVARRGRSKTQRVNHARWLGRYEYACRKLNYLRRTKSMFDLHSSSHIGETFPLAPTMKVAMTSEFAYKVIRKIIVVTDGSVTVKGERA